MVFKIKQNLLKSNTQFSSVTKSCPTLCDPMNRSTPGFPVHHQLPESTQTHVHRVGDDIQPSHPLLSHSPPALNLSQHHGLFQWVSSSHQVAKVLGVSASTSVPPMYLCFVPSYWFLKGLGLLSWRISHFLDLSSCFFLESDLLFSWLPCLLIELKAGLGFVYFLILAGILC